MEEELSSVTREEQFIDVLDKALSKITKNISSDVIADSYKGIPSEDMFFIQIAATKLLDEYKEEAKQFILDHCREEGVFEYFHSLETRDMELSEKEELESKYCGSVIDVNKLLCAQRMRMKKRLIRSIEAEIRKIESETRTMYQQNKEDLLRIQQGLSYLKNVPPFLL